jgi:formylglycine-generating enzyme required for sulfatase activity
MRGNVAEWCLDWHQNNLLGGTDPQVTVKGSHRVSRGGSWFHLARYSRSGFRSRSSPKSQVGNLGFRVALVQLPSEKRTGKASSEVR